MSLAAVMCQLKTTMRDQPFEHIEAFIEEQELDEEAKAVAWLYAWLGADPCFVAAELGRPAPAGV